MKNARFALLPMVFISFLSVATARAQSPAEPGPENGSGSMAIAAAAPQVSDRPAPPGLGKQILGGMAYGSGGLLAGGAAGSGLLAGACAVWGEDCGFAAFGGAFLGGIVGLSGGFPYGVYKFGTDANYSGSLAITYASALLGGAVGFGVPAAATLLKDEDAWFLSAMIGLAGAPIGALIGFNLTRGPRAGVPQVSLAPLPDGGWAGGLVWNLR
jgi:hypothetical protein